MAGQWWEITCSPPQRVVLSSSSSLSLLQLPPEGLVGDELSLIYRVVVQSLEKTLVMRVLQEFKSLEPIG